jgi:hypothetical protein
MTSYDDQGNVISDALWYQQHNARVAQTGQQGSQQWMAENPFGAGTKLTAKNEPILEQKLAMTGGGSADYARDWISLNRSTAQFAKDANYPTPSQNSVEIYYQNDLVKSGEQTPAQAANNLAGSSFDISTLYPVLIGAGVLVLAVTLLGGKK